MKKFILAFLAVLSLPSAHAAPEPDSVYMFHNKDCAETQSCDLKTFNVKIYQDQGYHNSFMEGFYETKSFDSMQDYAIVQFIKGCVYETHTVDGEVDFTRVGIRDFFGQDRHPFQHKDWQVDSYDVDPIYASLSAENDRHGGYKVLSDYTKSVIYDDRSYYQYFVHRPDMKSPRLYFSDLPTGGYLGRVITPRAGRNQGRRIQSYTNSSLQFKVCLYKTKDVPENGGVYGADPEKALKCFDWSSSWVLNTKTRKFENPKKIDPFCAK